VKADVRPLVAQADDVAVNHPNLAGSDRLGKRSATANTGAIANSSTRHKSLIPALASHGPLKPHFLRKQFSQGESSRPKIFGRGVRKKFQLSYRQKSLKRSAASSV
jgi:hypothetical protein